MSKANNSGRKPAFPTTGPFEPNLKNSSFAYPGITIRDWFAGQAMKALAANAEWELLEPNAQSNFAQTAYELADAMLLARSLPEEDNG